MCVDARRRNAESFRQLRDCLRLIRNQIQNLFLGSVRQQLAFSDLCPGIAISVVHRRDAFTGKM
jgi:hypothetical protein